MRKVLSVIVCIAAGVSACCRVSPLSLSPLPSRIERIEGHASLTISGEQGTVKSKFSFLFHLPSRARIDVTGALGSVLYRILIHDGGSFFIVPSKKVYWQGQEEEIIDKFLGFRLSLHEMVNLLSGDWNQEEPLRNENLSSWSFVTDRKGRIISGQREDLRFAIKEFIGDTPFASRLEFEHPLSSGLVRVLGINLNRPIRENVFSKAFVAKYQSKTWAEIQELLDHAR